MRLGPITFLIGCQVIEGWSSDSQGMGSSRPQSCFHRIS